MLRDAESAVGSLSGEETVAVAFVANGASEESRVFGDYAAGILTGSVDVGSGIGRGDDGFPEIAEVVGGVTVSILSVWFSEIGIVNKTESFSLSIDFLTSHGGF